MADHLTDAALLERFVRGREQDAFAALMRRHVPEVRAACRRVLRSEHDAEDVVQATFLVLALKAADLNWRDSVRGWLCAVARRLSLNARAGVSRRYRRETPLASLSGHGRAAWTDALPEKFHPLADPLTDLDRQEFHRVLDDELSLLPERFRAPVVLCDLEGLSHSEAARRLGMPSGSISRRLGRARALLRYRLAGRGLVLSILLLCCVLAGIRVAVRGPREVRVTFDVRTEMAPFKRPEGGGLDLGHVVSRISRGNPSPALREQVVAVARDAALVAERLENVNPGRDRGTWRSFVNELHLSALSMTKTAREGDDRTLLLAVRRADASCVQCHLVFRQ